VFKISLIGLIGPMFYDISAPILAAAQLNRQALQPVLKIEEEAQLPR
jgi:hypothetical protein